MNDTDAPATKGEIRALKQTILDLHRETHRKLDNLTNDMNQVKRDVNTIAENTGHTRDSKEQLRKSA